MKNGFQSGLDELGDPLRVVDGVAADAEKRLLKKISFRLLSTFITLEKESLHCGHDIRNIEQKL